MVILAEMGKVVPCCGAKRGRSKGVIWEGIQGLHWQLFLPETLG